MDLFSWSQPNKDPRFTWRERNKHMIFISSKKWNATWYIMDLFSWRQPNNGPSLHLERERDRLHKQSMVSFMQNYSISPKHPQICKSQNMKVRLYSTLQIFCSERASININQYRRDLNLEKLDICTKFNTKKQNKVIICANIYFR